MKEILTMLYAPNGEIIWDSYKTSNVLWLQTLDDQREHMKKKMFAAGMRMLRWMTGNALRDRIRNDYIHKTRSWKLLQLRTK